MVYNNNFQFFRGNHQFTAHDRFYSPLNLNDDILVTRSEPIPLVQTNLIPEDVEKLSWLNQNRSWNFPLNSKLSLFAHEAAASFVQKSEYEGETTERCVKSFLNMLYFEKDLPLRSEFKKDLISIFSKCSMYSIDMNRILSTTKQINIQPPNVPKEINDQQPNNTSLIEHRKNLLINFASRLVNDLTYLNIGKKVLFPGGWSSQTSGHALLYLFERVDKDHYNLIIFNTGEGSEYHPAVLNSKGEIKRQLYIKFLKVPGEKLNHDFFEILMGIKFIPVWFDGDLNESKDQKFLDFYHLLLPSIGEYIQNAESSHYPSFYIKPQRSGTCTMKSILAVLRYLMLDSVSQPQDDLSAPKEQWNDVLTTYKHVRYIYQRHALMKICLSYFRSDAAYNRSTHKLISDAIKVLNHSALKLGKKNVLNEHDLKCCLATIVDIRSRLKDKKDDYKSAMSVLGKINSLSRFSIQNPSIFTPSFNVDIKVNLLEKIEEDESTIVNMPFLKTLSIEAIQQFLIEWSEFVFDWEVNKDTRVVLCQLIHQLRMLPIPNNSLKSIWSNIPENKIEGCISGLYRIMQCLHKPMLFYNKNSKIEQFPDYFVECYAILSMADFLARKEEKNKLNGYQVSVNNLIDYVNMDQTIYNPVLQDRLHAILQYFVPKIDFKTKNSEKYYHGFIPDDLTTIFYLNFKDNKLTPLYINHESIERSGDLRYYKQFIENLKESSEDPRLETTSDYVYHIAEASCIENPLIPASVLYLRNIAFMSQLIDTPWWSHSWNNHNSSLDIEYVYGTTSPEDYMDKDDSENENNKTKIKTLYLHLINYDNSCTPFDIEKSKLFISNDSDDFSTTKIHQNEMTKNPVSFYEKVIQSVNLHDEIIRVLVYLEKFPKSSYSTPDLLLFESHFFRYNTLFPQLIQSRTVEKILNLLHKNIEYHLNLKKWDLVFSFILIANHFVNYVKYVQNTHTERGLKFSNGVLRDYKKWSLENLFPLIKNDEHLVQKLLCTFVSFHISKEGIVSFEDWVVGFATDWFIVKQYAFSKGVYNITSLIKEQNDVDFLINRLIPHVVEHLKNHTSIRNRILNNIISFTSNNKIDNRWEGEYPFFKTENYAIDFKSYKCISEDVFLNTLPEYLIDALSNNYTLRTEKTQIESDDEEDFEKPCSGLFNNIEKIKRTENHKHLILDSNGYTKIHTISDQIQIFRNIDGIEYRLITLPISANKEKSLSKSFHTISSVFDTALPLFLAKESKCWFAENPTPHFLIQNDQGKSYYIDGSIVLDHEAQTIKCEIKKVSNHKDRRTLLLQQNSINNFELLEAFATKNKLLLWADAGDSKKIVEIEMPRIKHHFLYSTDLNGIGRYFSQEKTGYFLSSDQFDEFRKKWPPYVVLENEIGHKLVLMLQIKRLKSEKTGFDPNVCQTSRTTTVHSYEVILTNGKIVLRPESVLGALNLAIVWLHTKHYRKAIDLIPECIKKTYSSEEAKLKNQLLDEEQWGNHPSLVFFRLKFLMESFRTRCVHIDNEYLTYLNQYDNTTINKLSEVEELNYLISNNSNILANQRMQLLMSRKSPISTDNSYTPCYNKTIKTVVKTTYTEHIDNFYTKYISTSAQRLLKNVLLKAESNTSAEDEPDDDFDYETDTLDKLINIKLPYTNIPIPKKTDHKKGFNVIDQLKLSFPPKKNSATDMSLPTNLDQLDEEWDRKIANFRSLNTFELKLHYEQIFDHIQQMEKNLIFLANSISLKTQTIDGLHHQGQTKKKLSLKDIQILFELGNLEQYMNATYLSIDQIIELDKDVSMYLLAKTRMAQLKRIIILNQDLLKIADPFEKKLKEMEIEDEFASKRQYSLSEGHSSIQSYGISDNRKRPFDETTVDGIEPPFKKVRLNDHTPVSCSKLNVTTSKNSHIRTYLLMEAQNEIFIREVQKDILNEIDDDKSNTEKLIVAGTGTGKSSTIAPLAERTRHTQNRLVFNVWPQSLYATNQKNMKKYVMHTFGQPSISFKINRTLYLSTHELEQINRNLLWALHENHQINTTPENLQCFQLKYLEFLYQISMQNFEKDKPANIEHFNLYKLFNQIFLLLRQAEFHIDEAHINLSPRKEVCFTLGSPYREPSERFEFVEEMFRFLSSDEAESTLGLKRDMQRFANPEKLKILLNDLVKHLSKKLNVNDDQLNSFSNYIWNGKVAPWMYSHPNQDLIVLLHQHITKLFPTTFQRSVNVNFGLSKLDKKILFAKPYHGNDTPIENAEYENPYETLCKSYLIYLYQGLNSNNLWEIVKYLQSEAYREVRENQTVLEKTNSYKQFNHLFGVKLGNLFTIQRKDIDLNYMAYKDSTDLALLFVTKFVAPSINTYSLKLKSTPQDLLSLSGHHNIALTATPGNTELYHPNMKNISIGSSEIQVKEKLISDNSPIHVVDASKPKEILAAAINMLVGDFRMLIDVGALFKGLNNRFIAEKILEHYRNADMVKGVVFFDESDLIQVLKKDTFEVVPLAQSGYKPDQLFTYCDQRHAFGTDTKQSAKAKALGTFDLITTKDEIIQGTGRLRGFQKSQKIEWLMTKVTVEKMQLSSGLTIRDMLEFSENTQKLQELEDIVRSVKHQMNQEVRSFLFNKLVNNSSWETLTSFFKDIKEIFMEEIGTFLQLPPQDGNFDLSENSLVLYLKNLKSKVLSSQFNEDEKAEIMTRLIGYESRIGDIVNAVSRAKLNKSQLSAFQAMDLETEIQNHNQLHVQKESHTDFQQSSDNRVFFENPVIRLWPTDFSIYNFNWTKQLNVLPNDSEFVPLCRFDALISLHQEKDISSVSHLLFPDFESQYVRDLVRKAPVGYENISLMNVDIVAKSEILCTSNFATEEPFISNGKLLSTPLAKRQKIIYQVLVIEDKTPDNRSKWTVIVGDQSTDALFWRENLLNITPNEALGKTRRVCLYDLYFGIVVDSPNPFAEEELDQNHEFQKLLTKIKLFNGDVQFNDIQRQVISEIAPNPLKKETLKKFFLRVISSSDQKRQMFQGSRLESFLNNKI